MGSNNTPKKEGENRGRPTLMTQETIKKLEDAFSLGCSDVEACLMADISKSTLYNYQEKHPEFVDRKEQLKEKLVLKSRKIVADSLNNDDTDTAKWYLERKKKAEFSTRQDVGGSMNVNAVGTYSLDILRRAGIDVDCKGKE